MASPVPFDAELPADRPAGGLRPRGGAPKPGVVRPIVVVDDDAVSRHVLSTALTRAGLEHVTLGSGAGALSYLAKHEAELLLLDLVMPDPDGYELLRILRADPRTTDLPVVVLTGIDADDEVTRAFTAGADDFVKKPFRADELVARVRGQLRLRAVQAELRHRERELEVVLELTQVLASNLDVRGILQTVVQRTAEVAHIDRVSIVLAHSDTSRGVVVAASDDDSIRDLPIALDRYPEIAEVLKTGEPLVIDDTHGHPVFLELDPRLLPATFRSLVILPIAHVDIEPAPGGHPGPRRRGEPLGVLFLRAQEPRTFTPREIALCRTVASAMAIALGNARRFQHLHEQTEQVTVERFEAERKVQSLQRFADFFESSADGMVVVDKGGTLLFSNRRARELTGFAEIDFVGKRLLDVVTISGEHWQEARRAFRDDEYPSDVDLRLCTSWGEERIVSANLLGDYYL
ncbi:response regulator, partial [bacterium]